MSSSLIGRTLGQFKVVEMLGRGGMATVYKGFQESVDRYVAIKVLPPHPGLDAQFIERFRLEARTIGSLQHPHILPLYDYGAESDILYLVMAYVEGGSLEDYIDSGPMEVRQVEKMVREMASALDYAHKRGIVHRDIKPGNILIDGEGHALLADFGIVKMTGGDRNLTGTGVVGTPAYMAPEQGQGLNVDGRADLYSFGVVVFEMLTGEQPYKGDTAMQVVLKHMNDPVPHIHDLRADLPEGLDAVMQKIMAKDPDERYQTGVDFAEDFSKAVHGDSDSLASFKRQNPLQHEAPTQAFSLSQGSSTIAFDATIAQPAPVMHDNNSLMVLLGGLALIVVAIVIVVMVVLSRPAEPPPLATESAAVATNAPTIEATPAPVAEANFGELRFSTANQAGDTVNLRLSGLKKPADGSEYAAWLRGDGDTLLALGKVVIDPFGDGVLAFTDPEGRPLPAVFNEVIITEESAIGDAPGDRIVYQGAVSPAVTSSLYSILIGDEEGINGGSLLDGAITEAKFAAQHAGLAANATNLGGMKSHSEHTINILLGTEDDYDGSGRGSNPGRKIGVYFFLDKIESHLNNAVNAEGIASEVQSNAENIRVCVQNVRLWSDEVIANEKEMLAAATLEEVAEQIAASTAAANALQGGIDANENGVVEPFEGECGLEQIREFGIQVANLLIKEAALE